MRAQRRAGEMLAQTPKATGVSGRFTGGATEEPPVQDVPTLAEIGITKKQSANWQSLASMSDEHFEVTVKATKDTDGEVTTAFVRLGQCQAGIRPTSPEWGICN